MRADDARKAIARKRDSNKLKSESKSVAQEEEDSTAGMCDGRDKIG